MQADYRLPMVENGVAAWPEARFMPTQIMTRPERSTAAANSSLCVACRQVRQANRAEDIVWLALAAGAGMVLALSLAV